jgi:hypothetical protein
MDDVEASAAQQAAEDVALCRCSHEPHQQRQRRVAHSILQTDNAAAPQELRGIRLDQVQRRPAGASSAWA